jgi:hypothetical protein
VVTCFGMALEWYGKNSVNGAFGKSTCGFRLY